MRFGCEINISTEAAPFLREAGGPYDLIARAGFDTTDVSWDSQLGTATAQGSAGGAPSTDVGADASTRAHDVRRAGLELVCFHSDLLAPGLGVPENAAIQEDHMESARALGCSLFLVHSLWINWEPFDFSSAAEWKRYLDFDVGNLLEVASRCRARHLRLVVENNPLFPLQYYVDLFREIPPESAGMCLDTGHANVQALGREAPLADWIRALGDRIEHLHLHGNDGVHDVHLPILAPDGAIDWKACFHALKAAGYRGVVHEELPPMTGAECIRWALLERGCAPIRELWETS